MNRGLKIALIAAAGVGALLLARRSQAATLDPSAGVGSSVAPTTSGGALDSLLQSIAGTPSTDSTPTHVSSAPVASVSAVAAPAPAPAPAPVQTPAQRWAAAGQYASSLSDASP